jgi:hypothetical protein
VRVRRRHPRRTRVETYASGAGLPEFVKAEFDAFLECGIKSYRTASHQKRISRPTDLELFHCRKPFENQSVDEACFHDVSTFDM